MRGRSRALRRAASFIAQLRVLPPRIALFQWRAWRLARRTDDIFATVSGTRPRDLAVLLTASRGLRRVVELGTGSAWTAISLVLADRNRELVTYDPVTRPERERYLALVKPSVSKRLQFVSAPGNQGPPTDQPVDLLYIDSSHDREDTVRELEAWRVSVRAGGVIVLDDFAHPDYPGVQEAVRRLELDGEQRGNMFIHRVGG